MFKTTCIIAAIAAIVHAIGYTIVPGMVASLYVEAPTSHVIAVSRFFGLTLLFAGIVCWLLRETPHTEVRNAIIHAALAMSVVGLITSVMLVLNGTLKPFTWTAALLYLVIGIGMFLSRNDQHDKTT